MFHWHFGYILKSKWYTVHKYAKKSEMLNILKICYRKLRSVRNLSAATCASTRPVQQHLPSESAQRAVWIRYAWRTVLSGTEAFPTRVSGCCEHANSWTKDFQSADDVCLWLRGTSESRRLVFGLRDAQAFFLFSFFLNRTITIYCIFLLVVNYMWILIVHHGRLRVPWQAKFLSRK